eukprot:1700-Heterococcus_DN1.PRE.1
MFRVSLTTRGECLIKEGVLCFLESQVTRYCFHTLDNKSWQMDGCRTADGFNVFLPQNHFQLQVTRYCLHALDYKSWQMDGCRTADGLNIFLPQSRVQLQ